MLRRILIAISCLLIPLAPEAWAEKPKVRATVDELFRDAMYRRAVISPGGRYVAAEFAKGVGYKVVVVDAEQNVRKSVLSIDDDLFEARISQVLWADTDSLLITVDKLRKKSGTRRESVTYVVDVSPGQEAFGREFYEIEVRGAVIDPLPAIDDTILYSPTSDSSSVYKVTLSELPSYTENEQEGVPQAVFGEDALVARLEDNSCGSGTGPASTQIGGSSSRSAIRSGPPRSSRWELARTGPSCSSPRIAIAIATDSTNTTPLRERSVS
jgi:hypothetical protein